MRSYFDFRLSRPGHRYRLALDADGNVVDFRYSVNLEESIYLFWDGEGYVVREEQAELRSRVVSLAGIVETSLYDAVRALGEDGQLADDFAEIFAWDIDFTRNVKAGDSFRVLYERLYLMNDDGEGRLHPPRPHPRGALRGRSRRPLGGVLRAGRGPRQLLPARRHERRAGLPGRAAALQPHLLDVQQRAPSPHPERHPPASGHRLRGRGGHAAVVGRRRDRDLQGLGGCLRQPREGAPLERLRVPLRSPLPASPTGSRSASASGRRR